MYMNPRWRDSIAVPPGLARFINHAPHPRAEGAKVRGMTIWVQVAKGYRKRNYAGIYIYPQCTYVLVVMLAERERIRRAEFYEITILT